MKIQNELDCNCAVRATLSDDGTKFDIKLTATAVYDEESGATATTNIDIPHVLADDVVNAMQAVLADCSKDIHSKMFDAISTMRKVAQEAGEIK